MGFLSGLGGLAGGILGDAFGASQDRKLTTKSIGQQKAATRELRQTQYQDATSSAKAAGLHPLFALGAGGGGGSPGFSIPGQSAQGSYTKKALSDIGTNIGSHFDKKIGLVNAQAALSAVEMARHSLSNDTAQNIPPHMTLPAHRPAFQGIEKGRVDAHIKGKPGENTTVKSPITTFNVGSQKVKLPIEDADQITEDPAAVAFLAYNYQGNKNVSWRKVIEEYTGKPFGHALATRNPSALSAGGKFAGVMHELAKLYKKQASKYGIKPLKRKPRAFAYGDTP